MKLFDRSLSGEKGARPVILIDVGANAIAGAYAYTREGATPVILYAQRLPIEIRENEKPAQALLRTARALRDLLIREGAPVLYQALGSGRSGDVFISIDGPWQETVVRTEKLARESPFVFTKETIISMLEQSRVDRSGKRLVSEDVIGVTLNGYEIADPYGKKAQRISIIVLTLFVDEHVAEGLYSVFKDGFHTKDIRMAAGSLSRYHAIRAAFPYERSALILDVIDSPLSILLMRKGMFMALAEASGVSGEFPTSTTVRDGLGTLSKSFPLPRIVFLIAPEADLPALGQMLSSEDMKKLWLSENPPRIVTIQTSNMTSLVSQKTPLPPGLQLFFMALYVDYQQRAFRKDEF